MTNTGFLRDKQAADPLHANHEQMQQQRLCLSAGARLCLENYYSITLHSSHEYLGTGISHGQVAFHDAKAVTEDGSGRKVLVKQAGGPEFDP